MFVHKSHRSASSNVSMRLKVLLLVKSFICIHPTPTEYFKFISIVFSCHSQNIPIDNIFAVFRIEPVLAMVVEIQVALSGIFFHTFKHEQLDLKSDILHTPSPIFIVLVTDIYNRFEFNHCKCSDIFRHFTTSFHCNNTTPMPYIQ